MARPRLTQHRPTSQLPPAEKFVDGLRQLHHDRVADEQYLQVRGHRHREVQHPPGRGDATGAVLPVPSFAAEVDDVRADQGRGQPPPRSILTGGFVPTDLHHPEGAKNVRIEDVRQRRGLGIVQFERDAHVVGTRRAIRRRRCDVAATVVVDSVRRASSPVVDVLDRWVAAGGTERRPSFVVADIEVADAVPPPAAGDGEGNVIIRAHRHTHSHAVAYYGDGERNCHQEHVGYEDIPPASSRADIMRWDGDRAVLLSDDRFGVVRAARGGGGAARRRRHSPPAVCRRSPASPLL